MFLVWSCNPSPCLLREYVDYFMLGHEMLSSTSIGDLSSLKIRVSQPQCVKEWLRQGSAYAHPACLAPNARSTTMSVRGLNSNPKTTALRRPATDALHSLTSPNPNSHSFCCKIPHGANDSNVPPATPQRCIFPVFHSWRAWLERPWGHIVT